jgi:tetratricopeptide (TPR) repeat protein
VKNSVEMKTEGQQAGAILLRSARALLHLGRRELAEALAELALVEDADSADAHSLLAGLSEERGAHERALELRRQAAELSPAAPGVRLDLAVALLRHGHFGEGLQHYETRLDLPAWQSQALPLPATFATLRGRQLRPGDPIANRHIVVFTEQGLGDTIFAIRFIPALVSRGARVTLICRPPLRPLFAAIDGIAALLSPPEDAENARLNLAALAFDAFCPLMSLPWVFGMAEAAPVPYLRSDPARVAYWRARYSREGRPGRRKVGIVCRANPANTTMANRSLPGAALQPLAGLDEIDFVNLQRGETLAGHLPHVIEAMREEVPLDEFGAAVAAADLVLSVDTMAAHYAGAMGHPVWVALPRVPAWYWGEGGTASARYPTATLFRQSQQGIWADVVDAMAARLRDQASRPVTVEGVRAGDRP